MGAAGPRSLGVDSRLSLPARQPAMPTVAGEQVRDPYFFVTQVARGHRLGPPAPNLPGTTGPG